MSKGIDVSGWWEAHYSAGSSYATDTPIDFLVPGAHFADLEKNAMRGYAAPRVEMLKCQYCRSFAPWGTTHCPQCGAPVQY